MSSFSASWIPPCLTAPVEQVSRPVQRPLTNKGPIMPNLAIVGYGKMGRMIDQFAAESGVTVSARIDIGRDEALDNAQVAIEFSTPSAVLANIKKLAARKIPIVVGTTGWLEHLEEAKRLVAENDSALIWSPNFSIGVNVFQRLVAEAARLLQNEKEYEAWA